MEETRIQELRKSRELTAHKEENQYLKNLVEEKERAICKLENEIVQQNMVRQICTYITVHIEIYKSVRISNGVFLLLNLVRIDTCFHYSFFLCFYQNREVQ